MNSFGTNFRVSIWGESHGEAVGITIDGCPPGIEITDECFSHDISRRKSGAKGTTPRIEPDRPMVLSGIYNNHTTGAPITVMVNNTNTRSKDYKDITYRPGHSDFVAEKKYKGFTDPRGGGHFSGRLTLGLVIAGVIAKKIVNNINIKAEIIEIGGSTDFDSAINKAIENNNSIGGIVECIASNIPVGLGEPFFDSVESVISHAVFSIPAIKGIEFGSGFESAKMTGLQHNDLIVDKSGKTETNNAGGINGGITNGNDIIFRVAVKPTSSIAAEQSTLNKKNNKIEPFKLIGRHDACIALRVPVVLEAVTAIALADLKQRAY
ncbi:MAG: chorismate synthase [Bacteroidales bacterium]|jgi:chorismate synthase|nr:chorismate synthase [Bacteroidales bacterium]